MTKTLTGSWFFTPTAGDEWYVRNAADTVEYEAESLYARFGHWLDVKRRRRNCSPTSTPTR